jgi:hypothetical protein
MDWELKELLEERNKLIKEICTKLFEIKNSEKDV